MDVGLTAVVSILSLSPSMAPSFTAACASRRLTCFQVSGRIRSSACRRREVDHRTVVDPREVPEEVAVVDSDDDLTQG